MIYVCSSINQNNLSVINERSEPHKKMYIEQEIEQLKNQVLLLSSKIKEVEFAISVKQKETMLTTKQAAEMLGIPRNTLLEHIRLGKFPATETQPGNKFSRYKVKELDVINKINNTK